MSGWVKKWQKKKVGDRFKTLSTPTAGQYLNAFVFKLYFKYNSNILKYII